MKRLLFTTFVLASLAPYTSYGWSQSTLKLNKYKKYLIKGTYDQQDWSSFKEKPISRYDTFKRAFEEFEKMNGHIIVELGTTRSFVHGGLVGCNSDDPKYWTPDESERWDWGAGCFTRMVSECLDHTSPAIFTIDLAAAHINRCKLITKDYAQHIKYYVTSSEKFLSQCPFQIDLLYLDTGNMTPIEETAQLHLREVKIIVERDLVKPGGLVLIDDVRNQTPKKFGETSEYGKAKYSLKYLLENGFEIIEDGYQVLLRKK